MIRERQGQLRGRRARWLEAGDGEAVLLIHGIGLSADVWRPVLGVLASSGWRGIAPDLPGFGRSAGPIFGLEPDDLCRWLREFADLANGSEASWVGHSLMCGSVLRLAADGAVRSLVLVSPALPPPRLRGLRQAGRLLRDAPREKPRVLLHVVRQYARASLVAAVATWLRDTATDPIGLAPRVRCPTLIVTGSDDPMSAAGSLERLRDRLPRARLLQIEGAAHALALELPERTADVVARFLRDVARG